ncbi:MAG: efflux transporter outer membrane subunit [Curvibacter sp.]|nr:efflux transporter outer membrane subunit [Curvibacter sp.]
MKLTASPVPFRLPRRPAALLLPCLLALSACSLTPTYQKPELPASSQFGESLWKSAQPQAVDVPDAWWSLFQDPVLSDLEARVNVSNETLLGNLAQLRQARGVLGANEAALFPTLSVTTSATRAKNAITTSSAGVNTVNPSIVPTFTLSGAASWDTDLWGKLAATADASRSQVTASRDQLLAARLSVQISLAQAYFALRTAEATGDALRRAVTANERNLELTRNRYQGGLASSADVAAALSQLKTSQAQLLDQQILRAQDEHAIAVLLGQPPANFRIEPTGRLPAAPPVPELLPSTLLQRRPDIAASERLVAAANAQIGVARAAFFPDITLSASGGWRANLFDDLVNATHQFWSFGPSTTVALLDFGARDAVIEQARAALDQAAATYRQTVLTAFQEVEDNLVAAHKLAEEVQVQEEALEAARRSLEVTMNQYQAGTVSYLNVVTAQTTALSAENSWISARNRQLLAVGQLLKNAAGRWDLPDSAYPTARPAVELGSSAAAESR